MITSRGFDGFWFSW